MTNTASSQSPAPAAPPIIHTQHASGGRFSMIIDGHEAVADYVLENGDRIICTHTYSPPELRGRGIAEKLVRAALAEARERGWRVVPACSYVAAFIQRHAQFSDLLA